MGHRYHRPVHSDLSKHYYYYRLGMPTAFIVDGHARFSCSSLSGRSVGLVCIYSIYTAMARTCQRGWVWWKLSWWVVWVKYLFIVSTAAVYIIPLWECIIKAIHSKQRDFSGVPIDTLKWSDPLNLAYKLSQTFTTYSVLAKGDYWVWIGGQKVSHFRMLPSIAGEK